MSSRVFILNLVLRLQVFAFSYLNVCCAFCFLQSHKKAGALWNESGLNWKDFLPEDEDVNKFVTEQVSCCIYAL